MVKTSMIFCLLCSGRCGAEGTAPNKLRSPRWRVGVNSDPYFANSLACIHTGICSIMNPNMTAQNGKITALIASCGIRPVMTRVHWPHGTIQLLFIWKRNAKEQPNEPFQTGRGWSLLVFLLEEKRSDEMRGERQSGRERRRKWTDRMRGVIEHNGSTGPRSARGSLARTRPPILRWQAANGGPLPHRMLMPNSGPRGLAPFPKHKERGPARMACMTASIHTHKCKR